MKSADGGNGKGVLLFPEGRAFSDEYVSSCYFVFGAAGFFTAITVMELAVILPLSVL